MKQKSIEELKDMLALAQSGSLHSIKEFKIARDYYAGKQLPSDVIAVLQERGQPPIHENILAMIMEKIEGYKSMARQDMVVVGRQREDRQKAEVLSDILKSISDTPEYIREKRASDTDLLLGLAVVEIYVKELDSSDSFGTKEKAIKISRISPTSFLLDPFSRKSDGSDAKYFIKCMGMDYEDALEAFGAKAQSLRTYHVSNYRKRVNVYEFWIKEREKGESFWSRYVLGDIDVLLSYEKKPFKGGNHPFCIQKYATEGNAWYGFFRNLKPQIDFINFAENRMANMIGSSKILYEAGAVDDAEQFATDVNIDNAVVRVKDGAIASKRVQVMNNQPQIAALSAKIADARATAQRLSGLNDETLGLAVSRLSGSAIEQRNNAGVVSLQRFLLASEAIDKEIFSRAIMLITHYFDAEQVFRIAERDSSERYFTINERERDEAGNLIINQDGRVSVKNRIDVGFYDISLHTVPHVKTKREDMLKSWGEIIKTILPLNPSLAEPLIPLMLRDTDSAVARDIEELLGAQKEQAQQGNPAQELELERAKLELEKLKAEIARIKADALKKVGEGREEMGRARINV